MPLIPGTRFGPYEVHSILGAGGMGEVYRARDTRLQRDVALKILPDLFAADPDRLARFQREAQVLASLNHPNIAAIHGLEDAHDVRALVLELVEGPTLADRMASSRVPPDEVLSIGRQISEALGAAHEHGIIHRDLKPANIKVKADGTVKILDFGLAKTVDHELDPSAVSQSPTVTSPAVTRAGVILGTAAYMAPEQATGKAADARSDIWAFGVVLYEMLTGRRAFTGGTTVEVLNNVLTAEPDWTALAPTTPLLIRSLLRRCLEKNPARRLRDIADARFQIEDALSDAPGRLASVPARKARVWPLRAAALLFAAMAGTASTAWYLRQAQVGPDEVRLEMTTPAPIDQDLEFCPTVGGL